MLAHVGRFEIQAEVGHGGFGQVFRAFDRTVSRIVAIKILTSTGSPDSLRRFRQEATAAGNLHHPNIVTVYEFGEDGDTPYLVMQYLEGQDLQDILKSEVSYTILQKVEIMTQVAEGLNHAHRYGVLHRDVKPANVMVLKDGSVKIMDFGIARVVHEDRPRMTQEGYLIGTIHYMAPELFREVEANQLCDIWAFGVIYREFLSNKNPFEGTTQQASMYKILYEDPPPLPPDLCPEALQPVLNRLLSKDPELRYQTLEDVLFDTQPILNELRRERAQALLAEAHACCESGRWEEAQQTIRSILALDDQNKGARKLRERVQYELNRRSLKPRVEDLIKQGEEEAGKRNYPRAIELYDSAQRLDSTDQKIHDRIEQLRDLHQRKERSKKLIAEAQKEVNDSALTGAFEHASDALFADPDNPDAARLLEEIQAQLQARERERKFQDEVQTAAGLVALEAFDEAVKLLNGLVVDYDHRPEVKELLGRAAKLRREKERLQRFQADLEAARECLRQNKIPEAIQSLERLVADHPDKTEAANLLEYACQEQKTRDRKDAIDRLSAYATLLAQQRRYDEAIELLQQDLQTHPDEVVLTRLLRSVLATKREYEREQVLQAGLQECRSLRGQGRWQDALRLVAQLLEQHTNDPELLEQERQLRSERDRFEHAAAARKILGRAELLLKQGQPDSAAELLHAASKDYPGDPEMEALLERAEASIKTQERQRYISAQIALAAEYEQRGDPAGGLGVIRKALEQCPGNPELVDWERRMDSALGRVEYQRRINAEIGLIERDLNAGNWEDVLERTRKAREHFPDEAAFARLAEAAQQKRRVALETLVNSGLEELEAGHLEDAEQLAKTVVTRFGQEPSVTSLFEALRTEKSRREKSQREEEEKQQYVATQLAVIAECESRQDYAGALSLVSKATRRYGVLPQFTDAQARVEQAQRLQREQREQRVTTAVAFIERELAAGDWAGAIEYSRRGAEQFSDEPAFARLADLARQKKREAAEKLVSQGRQELAAGRLENAERLVRNELAPHLEEPPVKVFVRDLDLSRSRYDKEQCSKEEQTSYVSAQLAAIGKLESHREWHAALELVRRALDRYPGASELLLAQTRIEQTLQVEEEQQVAAAVAAIEQELARRNWASGIERAHQGREQFPREPAFRQLAEAALQKKREAAELLVSQGRQELTVGRLENAERLVQNELAPHLQEQIVIAFINELKLSRADHDEKQRRKEEQRSYIAAQLASIGKLESRREWHAALELVRRALERYSQSPELFSAQTRIEQALRSEREVAISEALAGIKRALALGSWQEAIEQAEQATKRYPGEAALLTWLKESLAQKQRYIDSEVERGRNFLKAGDVDQAESVLNSLQQHSREVAIRAFSVDISSGKTRLSELHKAEKRKRDFIAAQLERVAALEHKQDFSAGIRALRKALLTYPDALELAEKLKALENAAEAAAKVDTELRRAQAETGARMRGATQKWAFGAAVAVVLLLVTAWMAWGPNKQATQEQTKQQQAQSQKEADQDGQKKRDQEKADQDGQKKRDQEKADQDGQKKRVQEKADQDAQKKRDQEKADQDAQKKRDQEKADQDAQKKRDQEKADQDAQKKRDQEKADQDTQKKRDQERADQDAQKKRDQEKADQDQRRQAEQIEATKPWHGAPRGTVTWRGSLQPNAEITIGPGQKVSDGQLLGVPWPRTEVDVTTDTQVSVSSDLLTVTLRNNSSSPIQRIELHWKAKHSE